MTKDFNRFYLSKMFIGATMFLTSVGVASASPTDLGIEVPESDVFVASPQQAKKTVTGTVEDAMGPIAGANIVEKGTTNGTITDMDGKFTLDVSPNAVLVVSFIGYTEQQIAVGNQTSFTIQIKEDSQALEEVVVVGYGTQKKVNLTGSVSSVDFADQALSRPITNVSNALAGLSAGVQVMQSSGQPGSDGSKIRIRGVGTLNNQDPLVLIDGVEGAMDLVNPQDIESISVLKDAASSSIYGSRAANGVVLITTKKGKAGKLSVSYSGRVSYAQPTNLIDQVTDYADYMEWLNESFENIGQPNHFAQSTIDLWREKSKDPNGLNENGVPNYIAYPNTDWQEALFGHGLINDHNVSVNGGTEKLRILMSAGYLDNPGLVDNTGIKKYSLRANIEANVTNWLTVGTRTFASQEDKEAGNFDNANNYLRQTTPGLYPEWNGQYGYPEASEESATANSILAFLNAQDGKKQKTNFNTTLYSRISPIKGLSWDFNLNYKRYWEDNQTWTNPYEKVKFSDGTVMSPATEPSEMTTYFYNRADYSYTLQNILRYNITINKDHDLGALAGYEEYYYKRDTRNATKKGLIDSSIHTPGSATEMLSVGGGAFDRASRSFFGRINYAYKSRYLFEANLRHDGNARYHSDYRWGTFPSFSAAWRISEEDFMINTKNWLDNLKLRVSYGSVGNNGGDDVGEYEYQSTYGGSKYPFGGKLISGLASTSIANSMLSWETSKMTNVGIDLNALNNRLSFTMDAFVKNTTGILFTPSIYLTAGNKGAPRKNIAEMSTKGVELSLGWKDQIEEVSYSVSGNFSYTPNKIKKYKGKLVAGYDENGEWKSNIGDVASSTSAVNPVIEDRIMKEYYIRNPYKGSGNGYAADGVNGGPTDGMIRTESDMEWLKAMIDAGHTFMPNKTVSKDKIWYGDYIYADANGDGIYGGSDDKEFQGVSSDPKYNFGFQMSAAWRGFDISMNWAGAAGFKLYWGASTGYNSPTTRVGVALGTDIANDHYFYNPENPSDPRTNLYAQYGRLVNGESGYQNVETSSLYLFNGNYLKLKNLTFGYTLPAHISKKIFTDNLRVYVSIENVFNITKYPGQDPELGAYPEYTSLRQFAFGANISF
ncbi:TonB-dependent receptor [Parabacteroides faecis]|uniref:SusC/RagA family TonB-linked outer membrane protein n=1 Tax=Parabacteroides TaxID=375288 RepID=UPI000EFE2D36|nr:MULTISPECIES: TonB-dependent receptor [Parabacteroides]MBC8616432.1 TonB-dependent receptor [Parabacteroides faecis]RHR95265.1 TonB-dependent receptor [Parabacteroides sp. AF14-59]